MFRKSVCFLFILLFVTFSVERAEAQVWLGRSEVGFTVGGMNYIGDLNNQTMFDKVNLAYGGF